MKRYNYITGGPYRPFISTTGTGYFPIVNNPRKSLAKIYTDYTTKGMSDNEVRRNLYDNLYPRGYDSSISANMERFENAVHGIKDKETRNVTKDGWSPYLDDLWATYLQIPQSERHIHFKKGIPVTRVVESKYKPTKAKDSNTKYYALTNIPENQLQKAINNASKLKYGENKVVDSIYDSLHNHTVGKGHDNNGTYVSYYDVWDLAPFGFNGGDQSGSIGTPINIYDRIDLAKYYGIPNDVNTDYLPQITIRPSGDSKWYKEHYKGIINDSANINRNYVDYKYGGIIPQPYRTRY